MTEHYFDNGWDHLVREALAALRRVGHSGECKQIKEKFGELRIYPEGVPDESLMQRVYTVIDYFEQKSRLTCETCGKEGYRFSSKSGVRAECAEHIAQSMFQNISAKSCETCDEPMHVTLIHPLRFELTVRNIHVDKTLYYTSPQWNCLKCGAEECSSERDQHIHAACSGWFGLVGMLLKNPELKDYLHVPDVRYVEHKYQGDTTRQA